MVLPPARDPKGAVKLAAKALKITVTLDPTAIGQIELLEGKAAPPFVIDAGDRKVTAQLSAKSLRKALGLISEHGTDKVAVILQGKLAAGGPCTHWKAPPCHGARGNPTLAKPGGWTRCAETVHPTARR